MTVQITPLTYKGQIIADRDEMLSLTDMWKAQGSDPARQPANWLTSADARRFVEVVSEIHNPRISRVIETKRGKGGATYAHWQVGLAYAKYLSPEFHMWCNTQVRAVMEGKATAGLPTDILEMLRRDDGMIKQVIHKVTVIQRENAQFAGRLAEIEQRLESPMTCTARDVWQSFNLEPVRGGTVWLGNRLIERGCVPEFGSRTKTGGGWLRRFDAGRAHSAMTKGLLKEAIRYIKERGGQGSLNLKSEFGRAA